MATIGDRIRQTRQLKGITQDDLAAAAGTYKQNIYKYEKNIITNIPMDKLELIAARLEVTPAWLLGWSDSTPKPVLPNDEQTLLDLYRSLNSAGQDVLLTTAQSLAGNPALTKDTSGKAI